MLMFLAGMFVGANIGALIMALMTAAGRDEDRRPLLRNGSEKAIAAFGVLLITANAVGWPWLMGVL